MEKRRFKFDVPRALKFIRSLLSNTLRNREAVEHRSEVLPILQALKNGTLSCRGERFWESDHYVKDAKLPNLMKSLTNYGFQPANAITTLIERCSHDPIQLDAIPTGLHIRNGRTRILAVLVYNISPSSITVTVSASNQTNERMSLEEALQRYCDAKTAET